MAADLSFPSPRPLRTFAPRGVPKTYWSAGGVEISVQDRERIVGCADLDSLSIWFARAVTATSTAELFAAVDCGSEA